MNMTLVCVGKLKEKFYSSAVEEYGKRLQKFCRFQVIEVPDEKTGAADDAAANTLIQQKEGARILEKLPDRAYTIALAIDGKSYDSIGFSRHIEQMMMHSANIAWIIGGSTGLSKEVLARADEKISFSPLTFPHQLMRVIFLEQLYRAFKIMKNEPYHK